MCEIMSEKNSVVAISTASLVIISLAFAAGFYVNGYLINQELDAAADPLYWVAPMDANYRRDKPGKSPMGMDLVPVYPELELAADKAQKTALYWVAPMDANYRRDKPGKSPMGMDLVPVYPELEVAADKAQRTPLYWVAPMDANYRRNKPGKSPMGMDLKPVYSEQSSTAVPAGGVRISPAVENNLGVRTELVSIERLQVPIDTVGFVQFDEDRLHHIHVRAEGWIEKLYISTEGDRVKAGQKLFDFFSPELANAQEDYLSLIKNNSRSLQFAAKARLQALGISRQQIDRLVRSQKVEQFVAYYAHTDGFISALHVRHGMFVVPASEIMAVGNIDTVWVIAEVFERQMASLKKGQQVRITVNARPGDEWLGRVDYLYPELDSKTRTAKVRVVIDNRDARLKPNMFAALVITAAAASNLPHIPRQALIRGGRGDRVVVSSNDGHFQSRAVLAGAELGRRVQIIRGLKAGERVVVSGQFLIDSESNLDAELMRLSAPAHDELIDHVGHKGMSHE